MAASLKSCFICNGSLESLEKLSKRPSVLLTFVRFRRRTTVPPAWWQRQYDKSAPESLTAENEAFLQEIVKEKYSKSSLLKDGPWERGEWVTKRTIRCGVICRKIGVMPQWQKDGKRILTTLLQVADNHVINYVPPEAVEKVSRLPKNKLKPGVGFNIVGAESIDPRQFKAEYLGLFQKAGVMPKRILQRFLVTPNAALQPGTPLTALHFKVGDYVDCQAKTIDYGFQGVVKRWGMKGGPASHGTTKAHRRMGSAGPGGDPSRIFPGKKMPGHMGSERRTLKGVQILKIDTKHDILYVRGPAIPGPTNCFVHVMDTLMVHKTFNDKPDAFPTWYPDDHIGEEIPEEIFHESLFQFTMPSIKFEPEK